jgi:EpsI family protein
LVGTGWLLHAREGVEVVPPHPPLSTFPTQLQSWTGTDITIEKETRDVLGPGEFLLRRYDNQAAEEPTADLFIAYFPSQRTGDTMHSPQNCLPGSGWSPVEKRLVTLMVPGVAAFPANRYVIAKGEERELVLYWYLSHGRALASEYRAKIALVLDSIRTKRSDGSLIRITTPLLPGETIDAGMRRLAPFADQVVPRLNRYIPR